VPTYRSLNRVDENDDKPTRAVHVDEFGIYDLLKQKKSD
jgi:hypothetical protein